ncbi:MAG TPA: hypothetical protein VK638_33125 [Edaphobacter sp.]|nr:hypothetical protein [Edaphobacter sp.]
MSTADPSMWVVYERPKDYPASYVVRRHVMSQGGGYATPDHSVHATLDEARAAVPPWTVRLRRDPNDEPQILESWI